MPKLKSGLKGVRRTIPVFFRISEWEDQELTRLETEAGLSRAAFFRCKALGVPFELAGGLSVGKAKKPTANA